ncbi:MAG: cupin domain-containing protein [Rhodospirillales bacterium]|nr:cupin domain-containing protein [Rhodospirillales bacterium]
MSFHRFEDNAVKGFAPHLSSSQNHLIEGDYIYFNLNCKPAGTGSEPHYHPNELLVFCVAGRINALVGKERHVISPGTFIVVPPNARHSFKATEEGDCASLYIKDHSWGLVGVAEDEAVPDEIMSVEKAHALKDSGEWAGDKKSSGDSGAIIEGLGSCFYEVLGSLEQPIGQCERRVVIDGERIAFGLYELPKGFEEASTQSEHEIFIYMLDGTMNAKVDSESREVAYGDIVKIAKGADYTLQAGDKDGVRFAIVRSLPNLEELVDAAPKVEAGAHNPR